MCILYMPKLHNNLPKDFLIWENVYHLEKNEYISQFTLIFIDFKDFKNLVVFTNNLDPNVLK